MAKIADLITRRWPGTPDAADAFNGLIDFALREKRTEDAVAFLSKVPETTSEPPQNSRWAVHSGRSTCRR